LKLQFSLSISYGGAISFSLAYSNAKDFHAITMLSDAILSSCAGGSNLIALYSQHYAKDSVFSITSGKQTTDRFIKNNKYQAKNTPEPAKVSLKVPDTVYGT
jgi:hypothetical protein